MNWKQSQSSENALQRSKGAKAQSKLGIIASSALMWKKRSIVFEALLFLRILDALYEVWIFSRNISMRLCEARKEGKVFFRRRLKNGMYVKSFIHRKEVNCKIVYILDSKLYVSNITDLVQQMLH
jgi:hypothetical protein